MEVLLSLLLVPLLTTPLVSSTYFPCNISSSSNFPPATSVHRLRPQDIGIIGAVGDSITAGVGLMALNLAEIPIEDRGLSFVTGGEGDWRENITVAGVLKQFNPSLLGLSYGQTRAFVPFTEPQGDIGFNVAISGSMSIYVPRMVKNLVKKIQSTVPEWESVWKLITILVGHIDVCNQTCNSTLKRDLGIEPTVDVSPDQYGANIREGVRLLHQHLPRTMVVLIPMGDLTQILDQDNLPLQCKGVHLWVCPCWFSPQGRSAIPRLTEDYRRELYNIAGDTKFAREDFTVEVMPTTQGKLPMGDKFLAKDCLHLSKVGNAVFGRNLWNNLIQPWGEKEVDYSEEGQILCPPDQRPFLATQRNS